LIDATSVHRSTYDSGISQATAYRYLYKALNVVAHRARSLQQVLADQEAAGELILCLDGTFIHTDVVAIGKVTGRDTTDDGGNDLRNSWLVFW
jgi:hypothetical protein